MSNFMNDFNIFFSSILDCLKVLWNWLITTTLGQIITFTIVISIFFAVIYWIIEFKN